MRDMRSPSPIAKAREATARHAMEQLLSTARMVREAGLPCDIVSAGGTGTYDITGQMEGITEIQAAPTF